MGLMKLPDADDRRVEENLFMSILVDLGVTYQRVLGLESALAFFRCQSIPMQMASRILSKNGPRRLTVSEKNAVEADMARQIGLAQDELHRRCSRGHASNANKGNDGNSERD